MPIASKLVYFQRRPSPAPPDITGSEPPGPRRRDHQRRRRISSSSSSSHHNRPDIVPGGHQRDGASSKPPLGSAVTVAEAEHAAGAASRATARLHRSASDHGRLPDAVQQARERLLERLNSVDLSGRRQKARPPGALLLWAGQAPRRPADAAGVSASSYSDGILGSLTNCFQPCEPAAASCKVGAGDADERSTATTPSFFFPEPVPAELLQQQEAAAGDVGGAAECSICLERCGGGDRLVRLPCRHVFHSACLQRWLRSRRDCPYCRATVRRS